MNALEKAGRIENTFHNQFYYKKSWSLSNKPEAVSDGVNPYREEFSIKITPESVKTNIRRLKIDSFTLAIIKDLNQI